MSATDTRHLLSPPSQQTSVDVQTPSGRSSRAYKVTGLTLLACVLIMGQAAITYFLVSQRSDIKSLQSQNDLMRTQLIKTRSSSQPVRMQMPINIMENAFMDEEASAGTDPKETVSRTQCELESEGLKPLPVPNYRPVCDKQGLYQPRQCFDGNCWCVSPLTGEKIPGSFASFGKTRCGTASGTRVRGSLAVLNNFG